MTISFQRLKDVYKISINQLDSSIDSTPFIAFKVSYSTDGLAYVQLPEVNIFIFNYYEVLFM